jgi:pyruvate formate lyase activating enzyme
MKEAVLYKKFKNNEVHCNLCNHRCKVQDGNRGICGVRENQNGVLMSLVYGKLIAQHVDPIEKKPLFHFHPGSLSYSIATAGCNFRCLFCQNADISQMPHDRGIIVGDTSTPDAVVAAALASGCKTISYTYTEPTIFFEFAYDTAKLATAKGLKNVFVSNGYMTIEALDTIHPYLHAANVDLKAFDNKFYKKICGARLKPVLETLKHMKALNIHLEVTTLLIPGLNDDEVLLKELAAFIVESLGPETPWHVSRFYPTYKLLDRPSTPPELVHKACKIGLDAGLRYVYSGNLPGDIGENTICYNCGAALIERFGFHISQNRIVDGKCPNCGVVVEGVWREAGPL